MKKNINFTYEQGSYRYNKHNHLEIEQDWKDAEEKILSTLNEIPQDSSKNEKCALVNYTLWFGTGRAITKKCFIEILEYLDLTLEDFKEHIKSRDIKDNHIGYKWVRRFL